MIAMLFLTGCSSGGFFSEEMLQISSIESELLADGQTKITIYYTDEAVDPHIFYIPKGKEGTMGEDGNGIKQIVYEHDSENRQTMVKLVFTNDEIEPATFPIPDGLSVIGIEDDRDVVTNEPYIVFKYSNNTLSDPIYLPKGDRGIGIRSCSHKMEADADGIVYMKVYFQFDDGTEVEGIKFPVPKDGNGIASMVATEDGDFYYIDVEYTDGNTEHLQFTRPADPNKWITDARTPSRYDGEDGDFFFDTAHKVVYLKENGAWNTVISFNDEETSYQVTFMLNDDDGDADHLASMPSGIPSSCTIKRGEYFAVLGYGDIPVPTREGYEFKGWYTKKVVDERVMSPFTDLTPVFSDLTLYAIWERV